MYSKKTVFCMLAVTLLLTTSCSVFATPHHTLAETAYTKKQSTLRSDLPTAIAVTERNHFYPLIVTPLAVQYSPEGEQHLIPLYVKNFNNPSSAVTRIEEQLGIIPDLIIDDSTTPKQASLMIAETYWESTSDVLIIKDNQLGYELGLVATPLASYLGIPVIVTDVLCQDVAATLDLLGVEHIYLCGDLCTIPPYTYTTFTTVDEIHSTCLQIIDDVFGEPVSYITLANPLDAYPPIVLDTKVFGMSGTIGSGIVLPTQALQSIFKGSFGIHEFTIPEDYKYCQLKVDLTNLETAHVDSLGDRLFVMVNSPDNERYVYAQTAGGIALRDSNGTVLEDRVHYETTIYDKPGNYTAQIFGQWFATAQGSYQGVITLEKLEHPVVPLMSKISCLAPYLTAYHKGIIFAKPEFAFAADDTVLFNGTTCPGVTQPGTNPNLLVPSNEHTLNLHDSLNVLLADIAGIPVENIGELREHYDSNPVHIAIVADPTMVPMYFYYNPDGRPDTPSGHIMGFGVPSDFIYADIDVNHSDPENNTETYWPYMENIVGRVTGRDTQDLSALLARTFYYPLILDQLGEWKNNGLVQTGCGLEFQNLPIVTRLSQILYQGRGEPTKFPTGESWFINNRIKESMGTGGFTVKNTILLESQREGFTTDELAEIKNLGLLNKLLFPQQLIFYLSSDDKVSGGRDHLNSSLIFTFAHGFYNLFEHGDVFIDSRGFPGLTTISRIYPTFRSGLSNKGSFDLRAVDNMQYGPSVVFVESCITGRTDGMLGENVLSQTYIHAGANSYIGATRVTADPGYLEPRPLPGGLGIGILGLLKAQLTLRLLGKYPDLHFGAVIAEDFILDLIDNDSSTGLALRNAKNKYLAKDANATFLWTPPLLLSSGSFVDQEFLESLRKPADFGERTAVLDKKYVALHEFTLYGDPAFNPYQPINEG